MKSGDGFGKKRQRCHPVSTLGGVFVTLLILMVIPAAAAAATGGASAAPPDAAQYVDPTIGTTGWVDDFPGADVPFGMVQLSPDTTPSRPAGGGYDYHDAQITGFSLTHISGPGCGAFGDVPILPTVGSIGSDPGSASQPYSHTSEVAQPGYYAASLGVPAVQSELTATTRSGLSRFTFPSTNQANVLIKLGGSANGTFDAAAQIVGDHEITGWVTSGHFCGAGDVYKLYFDLQFNRPFATFGTWDGGGTNAGGRQAQGGASGAWVTFDTTSQPVVLARVGASFVSVAGAQANAQTEDPSWSFDTIRQQARASWNKYLNTIQAQGGTPDELKIFYTSLYHSLLHPNVFSDVDGKYIGFDGQIHTVPSGHAQYANFSGWDIYRSQAQLLGLLVPSIAADIAQSAVNDYAQSGMLPKWSLANGESYVMVGDPAVPIIAGIYAFGGKKFDTRGALQAMLQEATQTNNIRPGLDYYQQRHYLPDDGRYGCCNFYGSVSTLLEYTSADEAIAQFASALGDRTTAATFSKRAQNWQYTFDPSSDFMRPKLENGSFVSNFVPNNDAGYVEGNAYQYTPMVPYNLHALINAMGGNAKYVQYLDQLFTQFQGPRGALAYPSNEAFTLTLISGFFTPFSWQGNEPAVEIPWEYDYAGAPWKTQDLIRKIVLDLFTTRPDGVPGNDDLGEMSSWYVWAAMGMFPEVPGSAELVLASPLFQKITIASTDGRKITIQAPQASDDNAFVQSLTVNGKAWNAAYVPASFVQRGGSLAYTLGPAANTSWAAGAAGSPPSYPSGQLPAIGFTTPAGSVPTAPAVGTPVEVGVQNVTDAPVTVQWTATASDGVSAQPASGTLTAPPAGAGTTTVTVSAPSDTTGTVTFNYTAGGTSLPPVVLQVGRAGTCTVPATPVPPTPGDISMYYGDPGISRDCNPAEGNFDFEAYSYSEDALTRAGLAPGATVLSNGITYHWPNAAPGQPDNVVAEGQTIMVPGQPGATKLGLLGSATNGDTDGTATIAYTDGSTQQVDLGFSDWTLGASSRPPSFGNVVVAKTPYRNWLLGPQTVDTYIFSATFPLLSGKTVASITLPISTSGNNGIHIFSIGQG